MPAKTTTPIHFRDMPRTFDALCRMHPLRPIHDRIEQDNATEIIDAMAGRKLNRDQADYLDALSTLLDAYESAHDPVDTLNVTGSGLLRSLMEANDMTTADAADVLGVERSLVSHILAGRRAMTWNHAKALAERFALPAEAFMD